MNDKKITEIAGGVNTPQGFTAGGIFGGIKRPGRNKRDIGILFSETECVGAGTYSQSSILSPSVVVSRDNVSAHGALNGIVVESGSANCAVGEQGYADARETLSVAGAVLGVPAESLLLATTGLIGVELPMQLLREYIPQIELSDSVDSCDDFNRAMMTTDTYPKQYALQATIGGKSVTFGGAAKGSGMIHPNMATMLAFITTDLAIDRHFLQETLRAAVRLTFNQIDVDGDQSTNDMVLCLANGTAGNRQVTADSGADADMVRAALRQMCERLAMDIARDAEGGKNRLIEVEVCGAETEDDALRVSRAIASSLLVKTAVYGHDPNWGRIMMAVGSAETAVDESRVQIFINGVQIVDHGRSIPYSVGSVVGAFASETVIIKVELAVGDCSGKAWGGELTEEYVIFNSAYTT